MTSALLALMLAAAPAAAPPADHRTCINEDSSTSWTAVDARTLLVSSGPRHWRVTTSTCPALTRMLPQINVVLPSGGYICGPHDAHIYVSTADGVRPIPCFMQSLERVSRAQAEAMTARHR